jgi:hypothetical protein
MGACLLAGCAGSSSTGGGPAPAGATATTSGILGELPTDQQQKPACGVVTAVEVEAAVGAKVGPPKETVESGRSLCSFPLASSADQSVVFVLVSSSGVPAFFESARQRAEAPQPVSAGDQAFAAGPQGLVRKGNTMVAILLVLRAPRAQLTQVAARLAQAVGTHL